MRSRSANVFSSLLIMDAKVSSCAPSKMPSELQGLGFLFFASPTEAGCYDVEGTDMHRKSV